MREIYGKIDSTSIRYPSYENQKTNTKQVTKSFESPILKNKVKQSKKIKLQK